MALGLFGAGLALATFTAVPPAELGYAVTWGFDLGLRRTLTGRFRRSPPSSPREGSNQGLSARIATGLGLALTLYLLTRWRTAPTVGVLLQRPGRDPRVHSRQVRSLRLAPRRRLRGVRIRRVDQPV